MTRQVGKTEVMRLVKENITSLALGTNGETEINSPDPVVVEDTRKLPVITQNTSTLSLQHNLNSAEGNGVDYKESMVYINNILLDRVVYPTFRKTDSSELITIEVFELI